MYNDYYLQEINNKIATTNNNLQDIIDNQELLYQQMIEIESGDNKLRQEVQSVESYSIMLTIIMSLTLIYTFVVRCLR